MKNKKTIIISISTISVILISVIAYILIGKSDNQSSDPSKLIVSNYKDGEITLKEAQIELNKLSLKNDKLLGIAFDNLSADQKEFVIKEAILKEIAYREAKKKLNKTDVDLGSVGNNGPGVSNPIPETFARVVPGNKTYPALGLPDRSDVFVTDAKLLEGLTPKQISDLLTIKSYPSY